MGPVLLLIVGAASAHEPGLSRVILAPDRLTVVVARAEVDRPAALLQGTEVSSDGHACTLGAPTVTAVEGDGISVSAALTCPAGEALTLSAGWPAELRPGHRAVVESAGEVVAVLDAGHATTTLETPSPLGVARAFVGLGAEHIVTGWDHLAFLAALLLVARSLWEAAAIVSGFTVAHSVTLSLAALGLVTIPAALVEPAIALTILWVGVENLWDPPARRRFFAALGLGLVHGFGFAGLLIDLGMPAGHRAVALVSFNAGVELGQLAVVAVALPPLLWLGRHPRWRTHGVPALSVAIAMLGLFWLVQRVASA